MRILLSNDDGINAPGLAALAAEMAKHGEIIIYAPLSEMSAVGHAITLSDPLRVSEMRKNGAFFGYAVRGTPADCVKVAIWELGRQNRLPDIVISGINQGSNTGINTIYSGTVSAATEGAISGIPAIAMSLASYASPDFSVAAEFAGVIAHQLLAHPLPPGVFLNVNVPAVPRREIRGVRITRQGTANWIEEYEIRKDPHNRNYYWLTGEKRDEEPDPELDDQAILENMVSITPVHCDMTCYPALTTLREWNIPF
ncbi:MAG TPA: 5'/3'-nucleotidase SurE [bacterium]|nr:5'/3'-nucleotidase SurE [bacterium]HQJ66225.1 5'/3'-nucleotidase SurE [bacterium]